MKWKGLNNSWKAAIFFFLFSFLAREREILGKIVARIHEVYIHAYIHTYNITQQNFGGSYTNMNESPCAHIDHYPLVSENFINTLRMLTL